MNTNRFAFYNFLVCVGLIVATTSFAQTKMYFTAGLNSFTNQIVSNNAGKVTADFSYTLGISVDQYISYGVAIKTGLYYWNYGYNTHGMYLGYYYLISKPANNGTLFVENISNKWNNQLIQVPLGIKFAPQGRVGELAIGINLNYLVKSTVTDLADSTNNYFETDITSALSRIQPDFFLEIGVKSGRFRFGLQASFSLTNRYSANVKYLTDQRAAALHTTYGSWYDLGLTNSSEASTISYQIYQISVSYRIY